MPKRPGHGSSAPRCVPAPPDQPSLGGSTAGRTLTSGPKLKPSVKVKENLPSVGQIFLFLLLKVIIAVCWATAYLWSPAVLWKQHLVSRPCRLQRNRTKLWCRKALGQVFFTQKRPTTEVKVLLKACNRPRSLPKQSLTSNFH